MPRYRRNNFRRNNYGRERALQHIREAQELSEELGGTDEDVKDYFFSLSSSELKSILDIYEQKFGRSPRMYAEKTFPNWRNGSTQMGGIVAARLFSLLPPYMPITKKYSLIESLWKHVGPSSNKTLYVGIDADLEEVSKIVKEHLEDVVINYTFPESMENRFRWLSQDDVNIKQQLLNYLRQQERGLLSIALNTKLPILINHLKSDDGSFTTHVAQELVVGKHQVKIILNKNVSGIVDSYPQTASNSNSSYSWIWWVIGIGILLWIFAK